MDEQKWPKMSWSIVCSSPSAVTVWGARGFMWEFWLQGLGLIAPSLIWRPMEAYKGSWAYMRAAKGGGCGWSTRLMGSRVRHRHWEQNHTILWKQEISGGFRDCRRCRCFRATGGFWLTRVQKHLKQLKTPGKQACVKFQRSDNTICYATASKAFTCLYNLQFSHLPSIHQETSRW